MVDLDRPSRRGSARTLFLALVMLSAAVAEPVAVSPRWQVTFPAAAQGKAAQSTAVPVGDGFVMVAVVAPGADPLRPLVTMGNRSLPVKLIGHDPVTRLAFLEAEGIMPKSTRWLPEVGALSGSVLTALEPGGATKCHAAGWAKQVGKKVLPLALLQVNFSQAVPPPGTALVDEAGQVAALVFQGSGSGNTGFAPMEASQAPSRSSAAVSSPPAVRVSESLPRFRASSQLRGMEIE